MAAVIADIRAGKLSRNEIARRHGISAGSVTNIAKRAGLTDAFDRSATARACEARMADQRALRSKRLEALGKLADDMVARSFQPYAVIANSINGPETVYLPRPPLRETESAGRIMRAWLEMQVAIEKHEAGVTDTETARSTLASVMNLARRITDARKPGSDGSVSPVFPDSLAVDS